jgi:hypothetical protein
MKMNKAMKCKIIFAFAFFFTSVLGLHAQEMLTVEEAVKIALENNFEIKIASNDLKIDEQNVSLANAGILPSLNANVINNNNILNTKQTQLDGTERELDNAKNLNLTYGVALNWTVFDGMRMFARHNQLKELEVLARAITLLHSGVKINDGDKVAALWRALEQSERSYNTVNEGIVSLSNALKDFANDRKLQKTLTTYV